MARITVWVTQPFQYDIEDAEHDEVLKAIENEDVDTVNNFINGLAQVFGAGYFGNAEITGIYDDNGNPLGVG